MASEALRSILSLAPKAPASPASEAMNRSRHGLSNLMMSPPGPGARRPVVPGDGGEQEPHGGLGQPAPRAFALQSYESRAGCRGERAKEARGGQQSRVFRADGRLAAGRKGEGHDHHEEHQSDGSGRAQHDARQEAQWPHANVPSGAVTPVLDTGPARP